jgi:hypothetical protein
MKFHIGQKIICDDNRSRTRFKCNLEKGEVYTVKDRFKCPCGSKQLIISELYYKIEMVCGCGHREYRHQSFYEWRFRPYELS